MINYKTMRAPFTWPGMDEWILGALDEDIGAGDATTDAVVDPGASAAMEWTAKSGLITCGLFVAGRVFQLLDEKVEVTECMDEGKAADPGSVILRIEGPARALLTGERVALNITQHLSGIATLTRKFVDAVAAANAKIAATRKTLPYLRRLEKYAVVTGGGIPHRFALDDGVLIKDNHIALSGSIGDAVARAKKETRHLLKIEVEVTSLEEAKEAMEAGADVLLLDNMSVENMRRVVELADGRVPLEASGNITLKNVAEVAATGVDIISVGALTHSAPSADISARIVED